MDLRGVSVDVREVAPRDGLQIEAPLPVADRLRLVEALLATGVRRIETTAFVSPRAVPAMAGAEELVAAVGDRPGVTLSALVVGPGGARRAVAAGVRAVEYVVSAADGHSRANARCGTEEAVDRIAEVAATVHGAGGRLEVIVAVAWDCPFDGSTPPARVAGIARRAVDLGADTVTLADTVGTATPGRVADLIGIVRAGTPDVPLGAHFHDTRGSGIANALTAVLEGVTALDAAAGGLGGCPFAPGASGNIATEELVHMLHGSGVATGVDLPAVLDAARLARDLVGHPLESSLLRAADAAATAGPTPAPPAGRPG